MNTSYRVVELVRQRISNEYLTASDTDIAHVLGVSRAAISAYKHGKAVMSPQTLRTAQKFLQLPDEEFDALLLRLTIDGAREPELRRAWQRLARQLHAAALAAIVTAGMLFAPTGNQSLAAGSASAEIYIMRTRWRRWLLRFCTVFPMAALATGCAALNDRHEQAWLALHAIDTAQTHAIVDDPCFEEGHPITRAVIGANPSSAEVFAWSFASAAAHVAVTDFLLRTDRTRAARIWQYVTLGEKAYFVGRNYYIGVRIGGSNKPPRGCAR